MCSLGRQPKRSEAKVEHLRKLQLPVKDTGGDAHARAPRGFSLIEVILAISLFSILLIGIAIIFGSVLNSSRRISETDQTLNTVGALQDGLQRREFSTVYQWTQDQTDLFLYSFRASTNLPVPEGSDHQQSAVAANGESTGGLDYVLHPTLRPEGDPLLAREVAALEGGLYRVSLSVMTNNLGGTNLPDVGTFTNAYLSVLATVDRVPSRSLDATAKKERILQIPVVINR